MRISSIQTASKTDYTSACACTMKLPILISLLVTTAQAFVVHPNRHSRVRLGGFSGDSVNGLSSTSQPSSSSSSTRSSTSAIEFLQSLLDDLVQKSDATSLIEKSSHGWRTAIYEAVGAPASADPSLVSKSLTSAMSKPDNQFAILLGKAEEFVVQFPSDTVDYIQEGHAFVEVQLREPRTDELLVTMGLQLEQRASDGQWLVAKLDWQDFRDQFYPGLSGREWLRAF